MQNKSSIYSLVLLIVATVLALMGVVYAQEIGIKKSSYAPVDIKESFATVMDQMKAAKPKVMKKHSDLLNERYDLSNR